MASRQYRGARRCRAWRPSADTLAPCAIAWRRHLWSSWRAPDWRTSVQVPPTVRVSWTLFGGIQNPTDPCERPYKPSARFSFVVYPTIRLVISVKRDLRPWLNQFAPSPEQGGAKRNEFFSTSLVQKCVF